ncbi:MAG: hypothetical protein HY841_09310 [Bacteroidetes bacterium]|nr:hypothetical protein [Bacteroidota bacterium]
MYGNISVTLSAADKAAIKQKVQDILAILQASGTTIINLTQDERKSLPKMGNKRYAFVKRLIQAVKENLSHIPPSYNVPAMEQDFSGFDDLNEVRIPIMQLFEKVDDTQRGAGSEAYEAALKGKALIETANRDNPGLDAVVAELQEFFDHAQQEEDGGPTPAPTPVPPPAPIL